MKILYRFHHGLGDAIQFNVALSHIKKYHPDWFIGVEAEAGIHSVFYGLADGVHAMGVDTMAYRRDYQNRYNVKFACPDRLFEWLPTTKPTQCIVDEFGLKPDLSLYRYTMRPTAEAEEKAQRYIAEELHCEPYAVVHYRGNSRAHDKDLSEYEAGLLMGMLRQQGLQIVLIDMTLQSPWADNPGVHRLDANQRWLWGDCRNGDAGVFYSLIDNAKTFWGVDSGPAHIAGATNTPSYVIWWHTPPMHCYDPADNVTHIVPDWWRDLALHNNAVDVFTTYYHYKEYGENLEAYLENVVQELCGPIDEEKEKVDCVA